MRTRPHALQTERIALPRRLVPRRPAAIVADTLRALANVPKNLFSSGDLIEFEDAAALRRWILIIGIQPCGKVEAAVYNGRPHRIEISLGDLLLLRVVRVERMDPADVAMYGRMLGPEIDAQTADRMEDAA